MAQRGRKPKPEPLPTGLYLRGRTYWMRYTDTLPDGTRKQILVSTGTSDLEQAKALLQRRLDEVRARNNPELADLPSTLKLTTFHNFLNDVYFKSEISKTDNFSHVRNILKDIAGTFTDPPTRQNLLLGNKQMRDITVADLLAWREYQAVVRNNSIGTRNRHSAYLRKCFKFAVSRGYYTREQWRNIKEESEYKQRPEPKHPRRAYTVDQLATIIKVAREKYPDYLLKIIQVAVLTSWRQGRIYSLRWTQIDFDRNSVIIPRKGGGEFLFPISAPLKQILDEQLKIKKTPYVFYNPKTLDRWKDLSGSWQTVLHYAGIRQYDDKRFLHAENRRRAKENLPALAPLNQEDIPIESFFHCLRHSFASVLIERGVPVTMAQLLLDHKNLSTTERYLTSLSKPAEHTDVLDSLGELAGIEPIMPEWFNPDDPDIPPANLL